jgi:hypothetical protein
MGEREIIEGIILDNLPGADSRGVRDAAQVLAQRFNLVKRALKTAKDHDDSKPDHSEGKMSAAGRSILDRALGGWDESAEPPPEEGGGA